MLKTLGGSVVGKLNILSLVKMYSYVRKAHLEGCFEIQYCMQILTAV